MVLAVRFETPACCAISSMLSSSPFIRMNLCSEGDNLLMACSSCFLCSCCRRGVSAEASEGMMRGSVSRSFCLRQTLTHRFFVALMSKASVLSPLFQPRSSIRIQTSCTTSSASSLLWKKLMATRIISSCVWRSKCSNSVCVICLYNARHREMSSKKTNFFRERAPTGCYSCRSSRRLESWLHQRR